ncbi:YheC/YheD family endospore coat-associated protein [Robertmurraya kyonggiensis]|uniref:YheC/YheD family protein n=1 Tax=Robertmurraya kyonggiensis TaxID=1037680 RepID=A0A4U1D675_9BACI|nr:YheC/YheD family protein [Robertmurraya kyonggiensis]TKC18129.1 YheC/YheD family protein [Robertmurraya kyonggiensis]
MLTLGFMTLQLKNEHTYFTEIAGRALKYDIECVRFIPASMDPTTEMFEGELYSHQQNRWLKKKFPLPDVLYDRCFYGEDFHSRQCKGIVSWLKSKDNVRFLGYGLPNKLELYEVLSNSKLSAYLPKTVKVTSPLMVQSLLQTFQRIILKPSNGSQGNGVYYIEMQKRHYIVKTDKLEQQVSRVFADEALLLNWLERLLKKKEFMLQPYLSLTNEQHEPFDIRSLLQKDRNGNWITVGKGIRQGKVERIVSNLSAGATVIDYETWIQSIPEQKRNFINEEIKFILESLPHLLEENFHPLFELGVDIGVAKDHSIWILDVNSKPGRKVLLTSQPGLQDYLYESPLLYANTIMERSILE